jgi:hypothetical protein
MSLVRCPHCGAENFTMEGWEDLDHCTSCDKPLGEPIGDPLDTTGHAPGNGTAGRPSKEQRAQKPRRAWRGGAS